MIRANASSKKFLKSNVSEQQTKIGFYTIVLSLWITSLFYVLPLGQYSVAGISTDFRIYDFMFIGFMLFAGIKIWRKTLRFRANRSDFHFWLGALIITVWLSLILTLMFGGVRQFLPGVIRAFRFTGYLLLPTFIVAVVNNRKKYMFLLSVYFINVAIQAVLAFLQQINILPNLWPDYWLDGYPLYSAGVGTLSPHHFQISFIMLLGIIMVISYFRKKRIWWLYPLLGVVGAAMFVVIILSGTRSTWFALAAIPILYIFIHKLKSILPALLFVILTGIALFFGWNHVEDPVQQMIETRLLDPMDQDGITSVYKERVGVWSIIKGITITKPWVFVTGIGFQNIRKAIGATGAHNNYLHVWIELGFVGFVVFMLLLKSIYVSLQKTIRLTKGFEKIFAQNTLIAYFCVLITMLANETLWAQYSFFTMTGQIMALIALGVSARNFISPISELTVKTKYSVRK